MEDVNRFFNVDAFYETLIDQAPLGIAIQLTDGRVIRANDSFCKMFGYTMDEVVGASLMTSSHLKGTSTLKLGT